MAKAVKKPASKGTKKPVAKKASPAKATVKASAKKLAPKSLVVAKAKRNTTTTSANA